MKKVISAALVLLALGVAAFFFLKMRRYLPERARAAELAPAETVLLIQFPNLRQTAVRIPKTDLYQIWREPDVQAFLEKPRRKAPWMVEWNQRLDEIVRVAPGEVFLAFTSVDGSRPSFAGGFSFAGSPRHAEALAGKLRGQLFPDGEIVSVVRSNWYFFATDDGLLARVVERFDGKAAAALAADPAFQKAIAPLGTGQDLVLYGKPEALSGRLDLLSGLGGKPTPGIQPPLAMATKIDGSKLRDIISLPGNGSAPRNKLARQTLALAGPQTLLYYATDLSLLPALPASGISTALLPGIARMEHSLAEKGLTWNDLPSAVGPELGAMIEWPEDAALPTLLLASGIRDHPKTRSFIEALTTPSPPAAAWQVEDHAGVTIRSSPPAAFVRPAVALTEHFALFGMSPEAVRNTLPRTQSGAATLGQTPAFQAVAPLIPEAATAFGYLDFPRLFERVYRMTRPFITLSLAFSPEAGAQWDAGKLPPVESITKHLSASVIAQIRNEDGMVLESIGSLTLPELLFGIGAGGLASGLPDLSGILPGGSKSPSPSKPNIPQKTPPDPPIEAKKTADNPIFSEKKEPEHK